MKLAASILALVSVSICAVPHPHYGLRDLPEAVLLGDPGHVSFSLAAASDGWKATLDGSLSPRVDVSISVAPRSLFDPELRLLLVRDLLPLNVVVAAGLDRISFVATLFLGPVRVGFGRVYKTIGERWATVQHAFSQRGAILLGVDERSGRIGAILGIRIHPGRTRLWGVSLVVTRDGARLTIGGTL
jgi:hypothetical protein